MRNQFLLLRISLVAVGCPPELSMDRNRNLFRQEYIEILGTGAGMELFCGLLELEQEFRLTVKKMLWNSCLDCSF